ncbi:hypothetical protein [Litchfieldia alkalitelluris]|uniref:hypothetical protein n=1 Tax=Litchfieldia alkalitelluris TaxID=304268 RepID=UPI0014737C48|nr:hypothetical protein [Litchfieldia alkalitelluris]
MLVVKSYFLSEFERFEKEMVIFDRLKDVREEEVFSLDDRELVEMYNKCLEKEPVL